MGINIAYNLLQCCVGKHRTGEWHDACGMQSILVRYGIQLAHEPVPARIVLPCEKVNPGNVGVPDLGIIVRKVDVTQTIIFGY
jgi:hypothetical protein